MYITNFILAVIAQGNKVSKQLKYLRVLLTYMNKVLMIVCNRPILNYTFYIVEVTNFRIINFHFHFNRIEFYEALSFSRKILQTFATK